MPLPAHRLGLWLRLLWDVSLGNVWALCLSQPPAPLMMGISTVLVIDPKGQTDS